MSDRCAKCGTIPCYGTEQHVLFYLTMAALGLNAVIIVGSLVWLAVRIALGLPI